MKPEQIAILLVGAPGSGKSTWGKHYVETRDNIVRLCPDEFRAKIGRGEWDQTVSAQAFAMTRSGMENALDAGSSVMIDATNMYKKTRKDFLKIAQARKIKTMAIVFEVDKPVLLDRNQKRGILGGRNVPEHIIDSMLNKYEKPVAGVEFDIVQFIPSSEKPKLNSNLQIEGDALEPCPKCGSSVNRKWGVIKTGGCINPECENYLPKKT